MGSKGQMNIRRRQDGRKIRERAGRTLEMRFEEVKGSFCHWLHLLFCRLAFQIMDSLCSFKSVSNYLAAAETALWQALSVQSNISTTQFLKELSLFKRNILSPKCSASLSLKFVPQNLLEIMRVYYCFKLLSLWVICYTAI